MINIIQKIEVLSWKAYDYVRYLWYKYIPVVIRRMDEVDVNLTFTDPDTFDKLDEIRATLNTLGIKFMHCRTATTLSWAFDDTLTGPLRVKLYGKAKYPWSRFKTVLAGQAGVAKEPESTNV